MKKSLYLVLICCTFLNIKVSAQCTTLPDECSNACSLGTLPLPAECTEGGGVSQGNPVSFNLTNIGATASLNGSICPVFPAADVWYKFTATGTQLVLTIDAGTPTLNTPNVSIYQGSDCNSILPILCVTGSNGSLNQTFSPLTPGTTYYLQISGSNLFDQGNFRLTLRNDLLCDNCLLGSSFTATPPPVNGIYPRGQTVNFCYTVTDYNKTALNWIHGVVISLGAGWDTASLAAVSVPPSCANVRNAHWGFYNRDSSSANDIIWGPGFYYETTAGSLSGKIDNDPGNNYGDAGVGTACPVTFCFKVTTDSAAADNADLSVRIKTTGDSQSGSWTSPGCETDPSTTLSSARIAACGPPGIVSTNASCGLKNGKAVAQGSGTGPWHYVWTNAQGNTISDHLNVTGADSILNLAPGQYFVTVSDSACSRTGIANIGGSVDSLTIQVKNVSCSNGTSPDGQITVTPVSVQNAPFTYSLNGGQFQSNNTFSNLAAGNYTLVAQNKFGCLDTLQGTVTQPLPIVITDSLITSSSCQAGGSIQITASGGTGNLSFRWSNNLTTASINNLSGGPYILTITDQNACSLVDTFTVGSAPNVVAFNTPLIVNDSCNGSANGSITATATGGTGTIKYKWSTSASDTLATIRNLRAGSYSVTATDSTGCSASTTYSVSEPAAINIGNGVITPVSCLINGSITITPTGGTGSYTYNWSNNKTTNVITDLPAGPYSVTVTDQNGCTASATLTVTTAPSTFVLSTPSIVNVTCRGLSTGSITVTTTGGTGTVKYRWNSTNDSTATISNLPAGDYRVTATDALGCTATAQYTVLDPPAITLGSANIGPSACGKGGFISVKGFGGTGVLNYSWSPSGSGDSIFNLSGGIYTVTVRDQNQCSITAQYRVDDITSVIAFGTPSIVNLKCNGDGNGAITVSATGGTGTIKYKWNNQATTNTITGLAAGAYSVTATDSIGCSATATYQITAPPAINLSNVVTPAGCTSGGSIRLTVTGGTGALTYTWSVPAPATSDSLVDLASGTYSVTVKDQNLCSVTASFFVGITQGGITLDPTITPVRCNGESNGGVSLNATGGTGAKNYRWGAPGNETSSSISNKPAGTYTVTVTDQGTCSVTASYIVSQPAVLQANLTFKKVLCYEDPADTVRAIPSGGTAGYTYRWNDNTTGAFTVVDPFTDELVSFKVTVTDSKGCTVVATDSATRNTNISTSNKITPHLCDSPANTDFLFEYKTGRGPFTFIFAGDTNTTGIFNTIPPGTYTLTTVDASGCTYDQSFISGGSGANATFTVTSTPATCFGVNNGTITISPDSAQIGFFQYSIDGIGSQLDTIFTNVPGGEYTIHISNIVSGCSYSANASVSQPNKHFINASPDTINSNPGTDNEIIVLTDFDNPAYVWTPSNITCVSVSCDTITASVDSNTVFYVKAYETNDSTCFVTDSVIFIVRPELLPDSLVMPTGFTPNGDGHNETFGPVLSEKFATGTVKAFRIYNRWGQTVHNSTEAWDGKFNGKEQGVGTYIYYIEVEYDDPKQPGTKKTAKQQGSVSLIR